MKDAIRIKCEKCQRDYWIDQYNHSGKCSLCGGQLVENMQSNFDYDTKRYLEKNN